MLKESLNHLNRVAKRVEEVANVTKEAQKQLKTKQESIKGFLNSNIQSSSKYMANESKFKGDVIGILFQLLGDYIQKSSEYIRWMLTNQNNLCYALLNDMEIVNQLANNTHKELNALYHSKTKKISDVNNHQAKLEANFKNALKAFSKSCEETTNKMKSANFFYNILALKQEATSLSDQFAAAATAHENIKKHQAAFDQAVEEAENLRNVAESALKDVEKMTFLRLNTSIKCIGPPKYLALKFRLLLRALKPNSKRL